MLSFLHSIQTHSLDISAPIAPFIVFAFAVSGQKCTLTSGKRVMHALAVRSPTWVVKNHLSLCIIYQLKCPLAFCLWMHTRLAIIPVLKATKHTLWYDKLCCHGTYQSHKLSEFCICSCEDSTAIWAVPYNVLDKDSKFFDAFKVACDLLQLNWNVLSGGNHNPMMSKRVNCNLNKGLKVMSNKRGSVWLEGCTLLFLTTTLPISYCNWRWHAYLLGTQPQ